MVRHTFVILAILGSLLALGIFGIATADAGTLTLSFPTADDITKGLSGISSAASDQITSEVNSGLSGLSTSLSSALGQVTTDTTVSDTITATGSGTSSQIQSTINTVLSESSEQTTSTINTVLTESAANVQTSVSQLTTTSDGETGNENTPSATSDISSEPEAKIEENKTIQNSDVTTTIESSHPTPTSYNTKSDLVVDSLGVSPSVTGTPLDGIILPVIGGILLIAGIGIILKLRRGRDL